MFITCCSDPVDENFNLSQFIITDLDTLEVPAISVSVCIDNIHLRWYILSMVAVRFQIRSSYVHVLQVQLA